MKFVRQRERGAVLIVAMIILVVVALLSLSAMRTSAANLQVTSNLQARAEGVDAAQIAVERVLSSSTFHQNPAAIAASPFSPLTIDVNRDSFTVVSAQPVCIRVRPVPGMELDATRPRDRSCMSSGSMSESGVVGSGVVSGSICSDTEWVLTATASGQTTNTQVTVNQGVIARVLTTDADASCN